MRQIFFDIETTGLDYQDGHRIIEIGCVELINREFTGNNLHIYLNPDRNSDPEALAIHGITREFLSDKPRFSDITENFLNFINKAEIIAHNAEFDVGFIDFELNNVGKGKLKQYCTNILDSLDHAKTLHPGKRNSLDALCGRYRIPNSHRVMHGALLDSQLLAMVWLAMTRNQRSLLSDIEDPILKLEKNEILNNLNKRELPVIKSTREELHIHELYLKDLEKQSADIAIWRQYQSY